MRPIFPEVQTMDATPLARYNNVLVRLMHQYYTWHNSLQNNTILLTYITSTKTDHRPDLTHNM